MRVHINFYTNLREDIYLNSKFYTCISHTICQIAHFVSVHSQLQNFYQLRLWHGAVRLLDTNRAARFSQNGWALEPRISLYAGYFSESEGKRNNNAKAEEREREERKNSQIGGQMLIPFTCKVTLIPLPS